MRLLQAGQLRSVRLHRFADLEAKAPEWWMLLASVFALVALSRSSVHHGARWPALGGSLSVAMEWLLMVVALMLPWLRPAVQTVAIRSLWSRRYRATMIFVGGYLGPWVLVGAGIAVIAAGDHRVLPSSVLFMVASVWQLLPWKERGMNACHRTMPLSPRGFRADRDCLRYGVLIGTACVVSCGPAMIAFHSLGGPSGPVAMVAFIGAERLLPRQRATVSWAVILLAGGILARFA